MSWALADQLKARFPAVELFPRPGAAGHETPAPPAPAAPGAPTAPGTPPSDPAESAPPESGAPGEGAAAAPPAAPRPAPRRPAHEAAPAFLTPGVFVPKDHLLEVCRALADEFGLHYLSFVSAIDRPEAGECEVLYHLYAFDSREELALKVRVPRDAPTAPSVTGIWDGANWHERETYDLFGVVFEGHPNLRRIMMTDDWVGHPLRKDYVYQDPPWLVEAARQRQKDIEGYGLGERA